MGKWSPDLPTEEKPRRKYTGKNTKPGRVPAPLRQGPFRKPMHPISRKGAKIQKET